MSRITWPMLAVGALALAGYGYLSRPVQSQSPAPRLAPRTEQAPRPNADAPRAQSSTSATNSTAQAASPPQKILLMPSCQSPGMATIHEKVAQIEKRLMSTASLYPAQDAPKEPEVTPPPPSVVVPPPSAPPPPPSVPPPSIEAKKETAKPTVTPPVVTPPTPPADGIPQQPPSDTTVPPPIPAPAKPTDSPPPPRKDEPRPVDAGPFTPTPPLAPPAPKPAPLDDFKEVEVKPTPPPAPISNEPKPPIPTTPNFEPAAERIPAPKKEATAPVPPRVIVPPGYDKPVEPAGPKPGPDTFVPARATEQAPLNPLPKVETPALTTPARPITSPWTFHLEIVEGKNIVTAKVGKTIQFRVSCDKVEMLSPHGNIQAQGNVKITCSGLEATTEKMTINLQEDAMILEGRAHLKCQREESGQEMELRSDRFNLRLSEIQGAAGSTTSNLQRPPAVRFSRDNP